jgi:protein farnesyltransferase/geranylgeranyltransferase type-1 subunit alpha
LLNPSNLFPFLSSSSFLFINYYFFFLSRLNMGKYSSSPTWSSVTPIPLDDGLSSYSEDGEGGGEAGGGSSVHPLATIAYSPDYVEATAYLRAVMAANEVSERALELTEDVIRLNPAHYTVW